jgi:hypothetical protein
MGWGFSYYRQVSRHSINPVNQWHYPLLWIASVFTILLWSSFHLKGDWNSLVYPGSDLELTYPLPP